MEFSAREGTDNPGLDYEKEIAALFALRYAFEKSVQDFWIATNVDYVGDMDDVVLCVTPVNGEKVALLLQLKHENPIGDVKYFKETDFTYTMNDGRRDKKKERFSLDKYCKGYKKFQNHLTNFEDKQPKFIQFLRKVDKYAYILYTNRGVEEKLHCLMNVDENAIFNRLNTSKSDYYGFQSEYFNLDEDFLQNLYLFPNQVKFEDVFNLIKAEIRKVFGSHKFSRVDFDDVTKRYLEIIKQWTKGCEIEKDTKYISLHKRDIINILSDILFDSYKCDIEENRFSYYDCSQKSIWNKLMLSKNISIVYGDDLTVQFLKDYIGSEVKLSTKKQGKYWQTEVAKSASNALHASIPDYQVQMMKMCGSSKNENITMVSIYKFLWFYKNLPLLLEINNEKEYDDILKILRISKFNLKVIVITTDRDLICRKINQVKHFSSLKDLNPAERSEITNLIVQFQGRISVPFSELFRANMLQYLKCADIIHMLCNDFNVGNKAEFNCNYYINRIVSKILISFKALVEIKKEFFLIEAKNKKECKNILTEKLATLGFKMNNNLKNCIIVSESVPKILAKLKTAHDSIHHLLFHEDFLEWKKSTSSVSSIAKYQILCNNNNSPNILYDDITNFLNSMDTSKFQIISACPGMGKSVLLNYIACFATSCVWILSISLLSIAKNYEIKKDPSEFFSFYLDDFLSIDSSIQNLDLSSMVFKHMLKTKEVLLLLDGFDEISVSHKSKFFNFLEYLQKEKYPVLITTRENMKVSLENKFGILSKTLKSFTIGEQRQCLTNCFKANVSVKNENSNAILLEFVEQLLKATKHNLTDRYEEFVGVPLQLQVLANNFLKECQMSLKAEKVCLTTNFDLLDLYDL